jgi:hypothetical protein
MSHSGISMLRREVSSQRNWLIGLRNILKNIKPNEPIILSAEQIKQLHKPLPSRLVKEPIDPYTLKQVLLEYTEGLKDKQTLAEFLNEARTPQVKNKIIHSLESNPRAVLNEIFISLEKRGLGNKFSNIYENKECINLINGVITLVTGQGLDFRKHSIDEYLSMVKPYRQNTFRNIAFGRLKEKFDPIDYITDPAIEGPEQVRQVLKYNPQLAVLTVFDFIKTCLEENNEQFSKSDLDLMMSLRGRLNEKVRI